MVAAPIMFAWCGHCGRAVGSHLSVCATLARMASNSEVARRLEVNHSTVSRLRSGERSPSLELFFRICRVYQLDADSERKLLRASQDPKRSGRAYSRLFETGKV